MSSKLKAKREERNMPQSQLAAAAGINYRTLQEYERERADINGAKLKTILKLCRSLECHMSDILTDDEVIEMFDEIK